MTEHVIVAGGGIGALEGVLALQELGGDALRISVLTPNRFLTYRALSVGEPFGAPAPSRLEWRAIARDRRLELIPDALTVVRPADRLAETRDGPGIRYDSLLLAVGARPEPALAGTLPFAGQRDVAAVTDAIQALTRDRRHRIAFVAPTPVAWTLPLYELAFMTARYAEHHRLDVDLEIVTREDAPLGIFGPEASADIAARLAGAGVRIRTGSFAEAYADGRLWLELEGSLEADLVIALTGLRGPALAGLPGDEQGFMPVDAYGRVVGVDRVWAVGDMTTRPLKQGGLAAQQADTAAADIAAHAGVPVDVEPYRPQLRGLLMTGGDPVFLEHRSGAEGYSRASTASLWWPPHKVAGDHVARYLERTGVISDV